MADRQIASGELELVREFVNTRDVEAGAESLDSPAALSDWFAKRALLPAGKRLGERDLREAIEVREAIRILLLANNDRHPIGEATKNLDRLADKTPLKVRFYGDGASGFEMVEGADGALGRILVVIALSMAQGTWDRLKVCRNEGCEWAFYDRSKNRSGKWRAMEVCGNRMKARAYRRRHAVGGEGL